MYFCIMQKECQNSVCLCGSAVTFFDFDEQSLNFVGSVIAQTRQG